MDWINASTRKPADWQEVTFRIVGTKQSINADMVWMFKDTYLEMNSNGRVNGDTFPYTNIEWLDENTEKDAYIRYVHEKIELDLAPMRFHEWQEMEKFAIEYRLKHK